MSRRTACLIAVAAAAAVLGSARLMASDPIGVYCIVDHVVMTPDEQHASSIQIWGACSFADRRSGGGYTFPQKGYLYYSVPGGKEAIATKEWADLKRVAGTGEIVGFGGRYTEGGRVRIAAEQPNHPDVYPIQMGVVRMTNNPAAVDNVTLSYTEFFAALKKIATLK